MSNAVTGTVLVFFSWQSDSPPDTNSGAIRKAMRAAAKKIKRLDSNIDVVLDEATRDTSGSPNIVDKIVEKIDRCQVYVADITTVTPDGAPRPSANPNVLIELGYAVAQVGWDRIILLFNESIGKFPGDLPFDISQNRVGKYSLSAKNTKTKSEQENLERLLFTAIKSVIEKNPKTPIQLRGMSADKIQHERDVEAVTWLLSQIHIPSLDDHISSLPRVIDGAHFFFWEGFRAVVENSLFHLYDPVLKKSVEALYRSWGRTFSFYGRYREIHDSDRHIFSNPGDAPLDEDQERDWKKIAQAASTMRRSLDKILARVRSAYFEVDVTATNQKAFSARREFNKKFEEELDS